METDLTGRTTPTPVQPEPVCPRCQNTRWEINEQGERVRCRCLWLRDVQGYLRDVFGTVPAFVEGLRHVAVPTQSNQICLWHGVDLNVQEWNYLCARALLKCKMPTVMRLTLSDLHNIYFDKFTDMKSYLHIGAEVVLFYATGFEPRNDFNETWILDLLTHREMDRRGVFMYVSPKYRQVYDFVREHNYLQIMLPPKREGSITTPLLPRDGIPPKPER